MSLKNKYKPKIPFIPYLQLPLKKYYEITEGYVYSRQERALHGKYLHYSIDYSTDWAEPVYAAASGYATASYHRLTLQHKDKTIRTFQGKPLGNGYGLFVQIYHPENICGVKGGRITQYGHLCGISKSLKMKRTEPIKSDILGKIVRKNERSKVNKKSKKELKKVLEVHKGLIKRYPWIEYRYGYDKEESFLEFKKKDNPYVKWVEQGELIGYTGSSGLIWGDLQYNEDEVGSKKIPHFKTWDEIHLHFEEAFRDLKTGLKKDKRDPYDIYKSAKWYGNLDSMKKTLFKNTPFS
jgi:hypothetical protein